MCDDYVRSAIKTGEYIIRRIRFDRTPIDWSFFWEVDWCLFFVFRTQGLTLSFKQIADIHQFFVNHPRFTCHIEPIRQTVEHFANNILNQLQAYCRQNHLLLTDLFETTEDKNLPYLIVTYEQFRNGLKQAKIAYSMGQFDNICKYLGRDDDDGTISLKYRIFCSLFHRKHRPFSFTFRSLEIA